MRFGRGEEFGEVLWECQCAFESTITCRGGGGAGHAEKNSATGRLTVFGVLNNLLQGFSRA